MKIITLLNEKGGVGKTTTATHLAAGLAIRGHRVVLVDTDPQGHATVTLGNKKVPGFYDLMVRDADFSSVARVVSPEIYEVRGKTVRGQLYLVPSNVETRNVSNSIDEAMAVKWKLQELEDYVDYVVIDTSPTPSLLHGSIYLATDAILYPVTPEYLSFDGFIQSIEHRRQADKRREVEGMKGVYMLGIVPTMVRPRTIEHTDNLKELQDQFGQKVWNPITLRTIWGQASRMHKLVWTLVPESKAAAEAWSLVTQFEKEVVNV
ncbi:MAG: ParA family protein [Chloroflexota bacterium]